MRTIVVCLSLGLAGVAPVAAEEEKKPVRTYTNEDLERVAPFKGETGALSQPAVPPAVQARKPAAPARRRARDESYWRAEAERVQEKLRPLRQKAAEWRRRLEAARLAARDKPLGQRSGSRGGSTPSVGDLEQRLAAVEDEIRERQSALEERARRAGALPGWIR